MPFTRSRSAPRSADQGLHGAGEGEPFDRLVLFDDETRDAVAVRGLGDEAGALAGGRLDDALRIERAA